MGAVNFAKRLHNQRVGKLDDASRYFVATSSGVGGRTIEALSKGAEPDLWRRLVGAVQLARDNATAAGKTYGIGAFVWIQGEWNYDPAIGGGHDERGLQSKAGATPKRFPSRLRGRDRCSECAAYVHYVSDWRWLYPRRK
ncbi:hypothetical protein [Burkholderia cenocepacia]|uniref:hypothetical protein n=1 Tax=Burkholderia cenocepacia TaxID=95486 RepID=UPI00209ADCB6|nr:hypothetical protein [Burkholderia cenocepacia]